MNSQKLRLIQCGVGGFGRGWLDVTTKSPDFEVVAIADLSPESLEKAGTACGVPEEVRFTDLETALNQVEADAVLSITPPPVHVQHARLVFGKGLHFMSEKPLAENLEQAKEMISLAEKAGRQLVVSQQYRYKTPMIRLKKALQEGLIGDLGHGQIDFYIPADFTGTFREKMKFPLLLDMAIHHVDLIRAITGRNVLKVTAHSFRPSWSWYEHDPGLKMLLQLEGGVSFSYSGDWSARGRSTSWNGNWRLQGAEGSLHQENDKVFLVKSERWMKNEQSEELDLGLPFPTEQAATLHHFAQAIRTGQPAETSGADNIQSLAVVVAAMKSVETGGTVSISDLIE